MMQHNIKANLGKTLPDFAYSTQNQLFFIELLFLGMVNDK